MHRTGTKHIVRHMRKSVIQWSVISKFTCTNKQIQTPSFSVVNASDRINEVAFPFKVQEILGPQVAFNCLGLRLCRRGILKDDRGFSISVDPL